MDYLEYTMRRLSNILYNVSQRPDTNGCNHMLDNIKDILQAYENSSGKNMDIVDNRKTK